MATRQDASTGEIVETEDEKPIKDEAAKPEKPGKISEDDTLHVKIWSPFKVFYDDPAKSVSAENGTGPFDILAHHHNFITLLNPCDLSIHTKDDIVNIKISGGIMHVRGNVVTVFLEV